MPKGCALKLSRGLLGASINILGSFGEVLTSVYVGYVTVTRLTNWVSKGKKIKGEIEIHSVLFPDQAIHL